MDTISPCCSRTRAWIGFVESLNSESLRFTSKPEEQDRRNAQIFARYLKDNNRVAIEYKLQKLTEKVVV